MKNDNTKDTLSKAREEIDSISPEQVDLAYDHAIGLMEEIESATKSIDTRTIVFLGYLLGALTILLSESLDSNSFFEFITTPFVALALSGYIAIIAFVIFQIMRPSKLYSSWVEPKDMLKEAMLEYDIKATKFFIIELLQKRIESNRKKQNRKYWLLNHCINIAFILFVILVSYSVFHYHEQQSFLHSLMGYQAV